MHKIFVKLDSAPVVMDDMIIGNGVEVTTPCNPANNKRLKKVLSGLDLKGIVSKGKYEVVGLVLFEKKGRD